MSVVRIKCTPRLRLVEAGSTEHTFGSPEFIARDRNIDLPPVARFPILRTVKRDGDVII